MKILDLVQDSPEWHEHRLRARNASEAAAMKGESKNATREDLLDAKSTGVAKEYSAWIENVLFARGHEVEAKARPLAEAILDEPLYPVVAVSDDEYLSASFDGLTLDETTGAEIKQWNEEKAAVVRDGHVPDADRWQVIQQLAVGAEQVLYMVTDGTEERCEHVLVTLADFPEGSVAELRSAWRIFDADLAAHVVRERHVEPVGQKPASLPALNVQIAGQVIATNLDEFRANAIALIENVPTNLETDQDFADADAAAKWCKEVEQRLAIAKERALSETQDVARILATMDEISETARQKRLALEKLVKARKEARRAEIIREHQQRLAAFVADLEQTITPVRLPAASADFGAEVKGKRSLESMIEACDDLLTRTKVALHEGANTIRANLVTIRGADSPHLFPDLAALALKDPETVGLIVKQRVSEAKEAEERRAREIAEREAAAKAQREAAEARAAQPAAPEPEVARPEPKLTSDAAAEDGVRVAPAPAGSAPVRGAPVAGKPSDRDLILTLCRAYQQRPETVIGWLRAMDLDAALAA